MLEILFSDSACASLKMAQRFGDSNYLGGCTGVIISHSDGSKPTSEEIEAAQREAEEKFRLSWKNAVPLGGNLADIYGFTLALSIGDISENQPGIMRQKTLEHMWSIYPDIDGRDLAQEMSKTNYKNLAEIRERITKGEALRVWYSNQPDDMCGLCWFMEQLHQWEPHSCQLFLIKLPEWESREEGIIEKKSGWGDVSPEEWHRYLDLQTAVPQTFIKSCAAHWRELQKENAPLRAVLNGRLVSVPDNIYDSFILHEIEAEDDEFQEAIIIGRVLGKCQLGIGDAWVALRIEEMIRTGILEAITSPSKDAPLYHRMLRKAVLSQI